MCLPAKAVATKEGPSSDLPPHDQQLAGHDQWLKSFDLEAFTQDIHSLGLTLNKTQSAKDDVKHLDKIMLWSNLFGLVGLLGMGFSGLLGWCAVVGISTCTFSRWTMIAHHICHGGYDKTHPNKSRFNRFKFAVGSLPTRILDWFDWMLPEAWNVEHNNRHHYCLSEIEDPDLVENNLKEIRDSEWPMWRKYLLISINMVTWKWAYYAPNTFKEYKVSKLRSAGKPIPANASDAVTVKSMFEPGGDAFFKPSEFFKTVVGPYLIMHFLILPSPLLVVERLMGWEMGSLFFMAIKNLILADMLTNFHSFLTIVTNHAGSDMYRFATPCKPYSGSFYLRQVLASADFRTGGVGGDANDFFHGFLNYQVEHHLWPSLSMLSYQQAQPLVKAICLKHNVPYVQMSVWTRLAMTLDIMVGKASMRVFPAEYEEKFLGIDKKIADMKGRTTIDVVKR
jgi:fatty acid desaturase